MKNVLFVAVTREMEDMAKQVSSKMNLNIPITFIDSVDRTEELAKNNPHVEVFISRGETAKRLERASNKPVVYITCSIHDILKPVQKITSSGVDKVAVIGSPYMIGEESYEYKIGNADIYVKPYHSRELENVASQVERQGITWVVSGALDLRITEKYSLKVELLRTEEPTIKRAID